MEYLIPAAVLIAGALFTLKGTVPSPTGVGPKANRNLWTGVALIVLAVVLVIAISA